MFDIKQTKTFMDSVHGYISIPKCFVDNLIDTEYFQRLHNVEQTGMRVLYPNGKHDRFSHSLGVYHLGSKAVDALLDNFSQDNYWNLSSDHKNILFWAKNKVLFLCACLLHDIGHAPFSHSLENQILENSITNNFCLKLAKNINDREGNDSSSPDNISAKDLSGSKIAAHELMGAMIVLEKMEDNLRKIYKSLNADSYPTVDSNSILFAEYYEYNPVIDEEDFDADICFIARMILGLKYEDYTPEKQIRNCFIELLNGSNFDVDKLDYIIRDTRMSGISNISIDVERLLNSISIVTKTVFKNKTFNNDDKFSGVTLHSFDNRDKNTTVQISGNFKGTFKFGKGAKVTIRTGSQIISLKDTNGDGKIYLLNDSTHFDINSSITKEGTPILAASGEDHKSLIGNTNREPFSCTVKNATVVDNDFKFGIPRNSSSYAIELIVNGKCNIEIEGGFYSRDSVVFFPDTTVNGKIRRVIALDNLIKNEIPTNDTYNAFSIGFKKQAINIIANVLEARDYLYLWCYAHHKVIYYSNFLIPAVSGKLLSNLSKKTAFPCWHLNYEHLPYLDDAYIWTVVRYLKNKQRGALRTLCEEILDRKYKSSLWKSLPEYDLIFESFKENEKLNIRNFFARNISPNLPNVMSEDGSSFTAGFVDDKFLHALKAKNKKLNKISRIVYVDASYKKKNLNNHDAFILMPDGVSPIDRIPLLSSRSAVSQTNNYFYLYYDTKDNIKLSTAEVETLKNVIKEFFTEKRENLNTYTLE